MTIADHVQVKGAILDEAGGLSKLVVEQKDHHLHEAPVDSKGLIGTRAEIGCADGTAPVVRTTGFTPLNSLLNLDDTGEGFPSWLDADISVHVYKFKDTGLYLLRSMIQTADVVPGGMKMNITGSSYLDILAPSIAGQSNQNIWVEGVRYVDEDYLDNPIQVALQGAGSVSVIYAALTIQRFSK